MIFSANPNYIQAGDDYLLGMYKSLENCELCLLLISSSLFNEDIFWEESFKKEYIRLIRNGLLIPIYCRHADFERVDEELRKLEFVPSNEKPINELIRKMGKSKVYYEIILKIQDKIDTIILNNKRINDEKNYRKQVGKEIDIAYQGRAIETLRQLAEGMDKITHIDLIEDIEYKIEELTLTNNPIL